MLHRAVLGSLERFMGILIENYAGAFPAWLHFEQVAVVPVGEEFNAYAQKVADYLGAANIRANAYTDSDNMKSKIKVISSEHKTPYILVVGAKEQEEQTVTCRFRFSSQLPQRTFALSEFRDYVLDKVETHFNGI
jgi:threonyl-tRNA synthetase